MKIIIPLLSLLLILPEYARAQQISKYEIPMHFLSRDVEKNAPLGKVIPRSEVITSLEGGKITLESHPENPRAQFRVVWLPSYMKSSDEAARILATSGAVQDCDIMLSFRPRWAKFNAYCNLLMGISHASLATIEPSDGEQYVHTVESPLSYSSRINYPTHYNKLNSFHVIRPRLTAEQKKNVRDWGRRIRNSDRSRLPFFQDYSTPYCFRDGNKKRGDFKDLPTDVVKAVVYSQGSVPVYCSELVWAILALRDISTEELMAEFPPEKGLIPEQWIKERINPMFEPIPGFTANPLENPGLMQGPEIQLEILYGSKSEERRQKLLKRVVFTETFQPESIDNYLSTGHARATKTFLDLKLKGLRDYYQNGEPAEMLPILNEGFLPNYSPSCYMLLSNLGPENRVFDYVCTVSYHPMK